MVKKYNFPIEKCPKCGGTTMEVKQRIHGYGTYYIDLVTEEADCSTIHDNLTYKNTNKYGYCADCKTKLFELESDMY